jgi:outer membrane receptor protein involved in Fe transport
MAQTRFIPGTPLFDLGFGLPIANWTIRGGVQNVADRSNWLYGAGTGSGVMPGQGRTYFVSLAAKF